MEVLTFLQFSWKRLCRIGVNTTVNIWQNSPVKSTSPGDFWRGDVKIMNLISLIRAVKLSISCWVVVFQGISQFHLSCQICVCRVIHSTLSFWCLLDLYILLHSWYWQFLSLFFCQSCWSFISFITTLKRTSSVSLIKIFSISFIDICSLLLPSSLLRFILLCFL